MLNIKIDHLERYGLVLVAVSVNGDPDEWVFLPFESESCKIYAASPTKLLAFSDSGRIRVFDVPSRTCIIDAPPNPESGHLAYLYPWTWSEARSALYVAFSHRDAAVEVILRQIEAASSRDTLHRVPDFWRAERIAARDDGSLFLFGRIKQQFAAAVVDIAAGQLRTQPLPDMPANLDRDYWVMPRWPSWDGRHVLRWHVDGILRDDPATRRQFDPLRLEPQHPDLAGSTEKRFCIALDLYRTWPFAHVRRIDVRWVAQSELQVYSSRKLAGQFEVLDTLADASDGRGPREAQCLFTLPEKRNYSAYTDAERAIRRTEESVVNLLHQLNDVTWDDDSQGFVARFFDRTWRHVILDGKVGPLQPEIGLMDLQISDKQRKPIVAALRQTTSRTVKLPDRKAKSLAAAMAMIAGQIDKGLGKLITNDVLGWEFVLPRERLPESTFYALVREAPVADHAILLPPLQAIFRAFGEQIGTIRIKREQLFSLEAKEDCEEFATAALGESALALATMDSDGWQLLKPWLASVDSEHDVESVDRVFVAIAERTDFATPELVGFGLWFERHMGQSRQSTPAMARLFASARRLFDPAAFAALAFDGCLADARDPMEPTADYLAMRMRALLDSDGSAWSAEAQQAFAARVKAAGIAPR